MKEYKWQIKETLLELSKKLAMILAAMLIASIFLLVSGYDFLGVFKGIINGVTGDFAGTIRWMTPLLFTSLAVCLSQKAKLFNLGADGQLYLGACAATVVALYVKGLPPIVIISLAILAGVLAGMLFAGIPALAKIYLGADEVVTTLLLNFIAIQFTEFLVLGPLKPQEVTGTTSTVTFDSSIWLPRILTPSQANAGIFIALIVAVVLFFIMKKTVFGHEVKITGANERYARYSGINTVGVMVATMLISGAIAGMAGSVEVLGTMHSLPAGFNNNLGFDGIVVALLAQNNPIGCILASFFFAALKNGAANMERLTDIPSSVSEIVQAIVILMVTVNVALPHLTRWLQERRHSYKERNAESQQKQKGGSEQ